MHSKLRNIGFMLVGAVAGVLVSLNFQAIADRATRTALPIEELRAFTEVFGAIKTNYVEPVEDKKLITEAINGMLTGLDPHSSYLDAEAFRELQVGTQGQFGGLGIEVGMEDGFVKVISPIEDTPAHKAGIKPGDLIIKLDDTPVKGMNLNDAVKRMRGKPKTSIRLTIVRKGEAKPFEVSIVRDVIRVQSVKSKMLEPGYGYVRVSQFQEHTGENLVKHIGALYKDGPLKGLVLDLRNDRAAFAEKHLKHSLHAPLKGGRLPIAAGSYLDEDARILLVVEHESQVDEAVRQLIRIGLDHVDGIVHGRVNDLHRPAGECGALLVRTKPGLRAGLRRWFTRSCPPRAGAIPSARRRRTPRARPTRW